MRQPQFTRLLNFVAVMGALVCLFMLTSVAQAQKAQQANQAQAQAALDDAITKYNAANAAYNQAKGYLDLVKSGYASQMESFNQKKGNMTEAQQIAVLGIFGSCAAKKTTAENCLDVAEINRQKSWTNFVNALTAFDVGWWDWCLVFCAYSTTDTAVMMVLGVEPANTALDAADTLLFEISDYLAQFPG